MKNTPQTEADKAMEAIIRALQPDAPRHLVILPGNIRFTYQGTRFQLGIASNRVEETDGHILKGTMAAGLLQKLIKIELQNIDREQPA